MRWIICNTLKFWLWRPPFKWPIQIRYLVDDGPIVLMLPRKLWSKP